MNWLREYQFDLGIDSDIFKLAYDGFWDVYTFKTQINDVSAKKIQTGWVPKIKLMCEQGGTLKPESGEVVEEEVEG